jgi:uncharacterized protein (DUF2141 family)
MIKPISMFLVLGSLSTAALAKDVTVEVHGVRAGGEPILASLQTREGFKKKGGLSSRVEKPAAGVVRITFRDVPAGEYAFSALHDLDKNGQMTLTPQYIPVDGWAMLGGEKLSGAPTFDDVKVSVGSRGAKFKTRMIYFDGVIPKQAN